MPNSRPKWAKSIPSHFFEKQKKKQNKTKQKTKKKTIVSLATFVALQVWYGIPNEWVPKSPLNSG